VRVHPHDLLANPLSADLLVMDSHPAVAGNHPGTGPHGAASRTVHGDDHNADSRVFKSLMWRQEGVGLIGVQDGGDVNPGMGYRCTYRVEGGERRRTPDEITCDRFHQLD
jgi:hypothetical protein